MLGEPGGVSFTTSEELSVSGLFKSPSTGTFAWNPYTHTCIDNDVVQYEYQLIRVDGEQTREGITNATELSLFNLECDTDYSFRVTYQTNTGTGPDTWVSIKIGLPRTSSVTSPMVQLFVTSNTSLIFTWDTHSPCNTQNDTHVMYDYELKRQSDNVVMYSAAEMETLVVFNNLEPGARYQFRVRVSAVLSSGGTYNSGWTTVLASTNSLSPSPTTSEITTISDLRVTVYSSYFHVSWDTDDANAEFQVIYQVAEDGLCGDSAGSGELENPSYRRHTKWIRNNAIILIYVTDGLYANSTYWITVQSRLFDDDGQIIYRPQHSGVTATTAEALVFQTARYSYKSMRATWNGVPDSCLRFEYQLLQNEDGAVVKEGIVSNTDILIHGLECDTSYQFLLRYTMNAKSGPWSDWVSTTHRTYFPDQSESRVRVKAVTPSSATFIWQPLQCHSKTYTIEYHYELQLWNSNQEAVQGVVTDTEIIFNNLEIGGEYGFRIWQLISTPTNVIGNRIPWTDWIHVTTASDNQGNIRYNHDYRALIGAGLGAILIVVIIIGLTIIAYIRKRTESKPNENDQATEGNGHYEVNLAMERRESTNEPPDYQDVNDAVAPEEEGTTYQGLDINSIETEHEYQGLGGTN
ncbi:uncharacterized protein [Amphiura filiformis]|uniref:uncharacterized protein n=1 Tax=Amphiura filiformis TaxID=82378 RepID=UPI003B22499C